MDYMGRIKWNTENLFIQWLETMLCCEHRNVVWDKSLLLCRSTYYNTVQGSCSYSSIAAISELPSIPQINIHFVLLLSKLYFTFFPDKYSLEASIHQKLQISSVMLHSSYGSSSWFIFCFTPKDTKSFHSSVKL